MIHIERIAFVCFFPKFKGNKVRSILRVTKDNEHFPLSPRSTNFTIPLVLVSVQTRSLLIGVHHRHRHGSRNDRATLFDGVHAFAEGFLRSGVDSIFVEVIYLRKYAALSRRNEVEKEKYSSKRRFRERRSQTRIHPRVHVIFVVDRSCTKLQRYTFCRT